MLLIDAGSFDMSIVPFAPCAIVGPPIPRVEKPAIVAKVAAEVVVATEFWTMMISDVPAPATVVSFAICAAVAVLTSRTSRPAPSLTLVRLNGAPATPVLSNRPAGLPNNQPGLAADARKCVALPAD